MPSSDTQFKKGICPPTAFKKGCISVFKGKKHSKESIKLMSESKKGKHYSPDTEFKKGCKSVGRPFVKGMVSMWKGKKRPEISGENHHNWKGGRSSHYIVKTAPRPKPKQCEICGRGGRIVFDHCHKSGKFRGWICSNCNSTLGFVNDNCIILAQMVNYLNENNG